MAYTVVSIGKTTAAPIDFVGSYQGFSVSINNMDIPYVKFANIIIFCSFIGRFRSRDRLVCLGNKTPTVA